MKKKLLILTILALGLFLRFYRLDFGLPQSFRADEPELVEPAIFYTFQIRDVVKNNNYYKLIPISYVYGTFPAYLFTLFVMGSSKAHNLLNITFPKENMYLLIRAFHALISLAIPIGGAWLYKKIFKNKTGAIFVLLFLALNWKLIVLGHYANADLIITGLLTFSFIPLYAYYKKKKDDTILTISVAVLYGLAVGTKITVLLTLPLYLYIFIIKKNYRNSLAFIMIVLGVFIFTNPFALIFSDTFMLRVMEMATKESGMVLDSVNLSPFKYLSSLLYTTTPLLGALSLIGIYKKLKEKTESPIHIFLIGHMVIYLLFFSLGNRRVDRWLLPILPITIMYGAYGLRKITETFSKKGSILLTTIVIVSVCYYPAILMTQLKREVPKAEAYLWMRDNVDHLSAKLVITEEGLDPMNKLKFSTVVQYPVYASEGAQFFLPPIPTMYDYVVLSSRPMENFKREAVRDAFPHYTQRMEEFENTILDKEKFKLIKSFVLPKPNLIPLSDVFIYENLYR